MRDYKFRQRLLLNIPDRAGCIDRGATNDVRIFRIPVETGQWRGELLCLIVDQVTTELNLIVLDFENFKTV